MYVPVRSTIANQPVTHNQTIVPGGEPGFGRRLLQHPERNFASSRADQRAADNRHPNHGNHVAPARPNSF